MRRRWYDYDDGFDEVALHEDEDFEFPAIERRPAIKVRPKLRAVPRKTRRPGRYEDNEHHKRIARVKAWGVPY